MGQARGLRRPLRPPFSFRKTDIRGRVGPPACPTKLKRLTGSPTPPSTAGTPSPRNLSSASRAPRCPDAAVPDVRRAAARRPPPHHWGFACSTARKLSAAAGTPRLSTSAISQVELIVQVRAVAFQRFAETLDRRRQIAPRLGRPQVVVDFVQRHAGRHRFETFRRQPRSRPSGSSTGPERTAPPGSADRRDAPAPATPPPPGNPSCSNTTCPVGSTAGNSRIQARRLHEEPVLLAPGWPPAVPRM